MNLLLNLFCIPQMGPNLVQLHAYARPEVEICCEWTDTIELQPVPKLSCEYLPTDTYVWTRTNSLIPNASECTNSY